MKDNKVRQIYIKQKDEVDELFNEVDDFFEKMKEKEEAGRDLYFSEMREFYSLWCKYCQAQIALDNITDVEFDVKDEEISDN